MTCGTDRTVVGPQCTLVYLAHHSVPRNHTRVDNDWAPDDLSQLDFMRFHYDRRGTEVDLKNISLFEMDLGMLLRNMIQIRGSCKLEHSHRRK